MLRCDLPRLSRCHSETTGIESALPRVKPFHLIPQREIVLYAHFRKLVFFSKECPYAVTCITDIIHTAEMFEAFNSVQPHEKESMHHPVLGKCSKCGYMSSHPICMACELLSKLVIPSKADQDVGK